MLFRRETDFARRHLVQGAAIVGNAVAIHLGMHYIGIAATHPGRPVLQVFLIGPGINAGRPRHDGLRLDGLDRQIQAAAKVTEFVRTPAQPGRVFEICRRRGAVMLGAIQAVGKGGIAAFAGIGRQPVITLHAVDLIIAHHLQHQRQHEFLHFRMIRIHPFKAILGEQVAVAIALGPMRLAAQQMAAVFLIGGGKTELEPGDDRQAMPVRGLNQLFQRIAITVARIDGQAEQAVHHGAAIGGHGLVPYHRIDNVEIVFGEKAHGFLDARAAVQHLTVDIGEPDAAPFGGRGRFLRRREAAA